MINLEELDKTKIYAIENVNDFNITLMIYGPSWPNDINKWCLYNTYFDDWRVEVSPKYWTVIGEM